VARFLIVGSRERARELAELIERDSHVVELVDVPGRDSLEHVAIVCWLSERSPERFLLGAVDSSMRGFVYEAHAWEPVVLEAAVRNSIPVVAIRVDRRDTSAWEREALAAIEELLEGVPRPRRGE
jgi:hypothetical protein